MAVDYVRTVFLIVILIQIAQVRREEFVCRELDAPEQVAGVLRAAARRALFFRNTEIISWDHHLDIAFDLDNGKQANSDEHDFAEARRACFTADVAQDFRREARAFAARRAVDKLDIKRDGIRYLYSGLQIGLSQPAARQPRQIGSLGK